MGGKSTNKNDRPKLPIGTSGTASGFSSEAIALMNKISGFRETNNNTPIKTTKITNDDIGSLKKLSKTAGDLLEKIRNEDIKQTKKQILSESEQDKLKFSQEKLEQDLQIATDVANKPGQQEKGQQMAQKALSEAAKATGNAVPKQKKEEIKKPLKEVKEAGKKLSETLYKSARTPTDRNVVGNALFSVWGKMIDGILGMTGLVAPNATAGIQEIREDMTSPLEDSYKEMYGEQQKQFDDFQAEARQALLKLNPELSKREQDLIDLSAITADGRLQSFNKNKSSKAAKDIADPALNTPELTALQTLAITNRGIYYPEANSEDLPRDRIYKIFQKIGIEDEIKSRYIPEAEKALHVAEQKLEEATKQNLPPKEIEALQTQIALKKEGLRNAYDLAEAEIDNLVLGVKLTKYQHPETVGLVFAAENGYHVLVQDFLTGLQAEAGHVKDYPNEEREKIIEEARKDIRENKTAPRDALEKAKQIFDEKKKQAEEKHKKDEQLRLEQEKEEKQAQEEKEKQTRIVQQQEELAKQKETLEETKQRVMSARQVLAGKQTTSIDKFIRGDMTPKKYVDEQDAAMSEYKKEISELAKTIQQMKDGEDKNKQMQLLNEAIASMNKTSSQHQFIKNVILPVSKKQGWAPTTDANTIKGREAFIRNMSILYGGLSQKIIAKINSQNFEGVIATLSQSIKTNILDNMAKNGSFGLLTKGDKQNSQMVNTIIGSTCIKLLMDAVQNAQLYPLSANSIDELQQQQRRFKDELVVKAKDLLLKAGLSMDAVKQIIKTHQPLINGL